MVLIRACLISHSYMPRASRYKLDAIAATGEVDLHLLGPAAYDTLSLVDETILEASANDRLEVVSSPTWFAKQLIGPVYTDLFRFVRGVEPQIIQVEEEPWSIALLQAIIARRLIVPTAKVLFFTWENTFYPTGVIERLLCKVNLRWADAAIAGNSGAKMLLENRGFHEPIHVLPMLGVDTNLYRRMDVQSLRLKLALDGFVIGYVGRLVEEKGLRTLVEAFAQLEQGVQLLIIGDGPLREYLCGVNREMGNRIRLVGSVPHSDVPHYINCMDVLVLPSKTTQRWTEQFGHVLIEAMACEVPVVGSSSGAIPEVIGDAGLCFAEGDVDDLRAKLQMLQTSTALRQSLARAVRQRVLNHFRQEVIAQKTVEIYQSLLAGD